MFLFSGVEGGTPLTPVQHLPVSQQPEQGVWCPFTAEQAETRGVKLPTEVSHFCPCSVIKTELKAGCQWLTPIILATQEAEIRRIVVGSQPREIVRETLS
jgi:hypothetical protein